MFIPETARRYGLEVSATHDERLDVMRETQAAAALLSDLCALRRLAGGRSEAYNQGEKKVDDALAQGGSRDVTALVAGRLNEYAATVQAGLLIVRNPHLLDGAAAQVHVRRGLAGAPPPSVARLAGE